MQFWQDFLNAISLPVDGPTNPKAKAIFARRILPGMVALLVAAIVAAAFAVVHIARKIDQDALQQSRFLAGKALQAQHEWMNRSIVDYAFWGDAYVHLNQQVDVNWAFTQANLGPSLYKDFDYEAVLVITPTGETPYAVIQGKLQSVDAFQYLQHGLPELLTRARAAAENDAGASALLWVDGQPAVVAAASLATGGADIEEHEGPPSTLVFVDVLDTARLEAIGGQYAVEQLRLLVEPSDQTGPIISQALEDGTAVHFTWTAPQPGPVASGHPARSRRRGTRPWAAGLAAGAPCAARDAPARRQLRTTRLQPLSAGRERGAFPRCGGSGLRLDLGDRRTSAPDLPFQPLPADHRPRTGTVAGPPAAGAADHRQRGAAKLARGPTAHRCAAATAPPMAASAIAGWLRAPSNTTASCSATAAPPAT